MAFRDHETYYYLFCRLFTQSFFDRQGAKKLRRFRFRFFYCNNNNYNPGTIYYSLQYWSTHKFQENCYNILYIIIIQVWGGSINPPRPLLPPCWIVVLFKRSKDEFLSSYEGKITEIGCFSRKIILCDFVAFVI